MSVCQGCGAPVEQPARGRRKWCSERCRKAQYAGSCVDCGAPTSGSDGRADGRPGRRPRCVSCGVKWRSARRAAKAEALRYRVVALWNAGLTNREIAADIGWTKPRSVSVFVCSLRGAGYDLPYRRPDIAENARRAAEKRWGRAA